MRRTLIIGLVAAVLGGLAVAIGSWLNLGLSDVLLGTTLGAALALVPGDSYGRRVAAFLTGFLIAWMGYAVRAAVLPDVTISRVLVVFGSVLLIALACALSRGRLPFWGALLGAAAMTGAYEFTYVAAPYNFLTESVTTATGILVAVAFGFLITLVLPLLPSAAPSPAAGAQDPVAAATNEVTS